MRKAERLVAAQQAYHHMLEVLSLAGAVLGKVEKEYARVFQRYRDACGTGYYATNDGICKDAWEEMQAVKKA